MCGLQESITACAVLLWDEYAFLAESDRRGRKCLKYRVVEISSSVFGFGSAVSMHPPPCEILDVQCI